VLVISTAHERVHGQVGSWIQTHVLVNFNSVTSVCTAR